MKHVIVIKLLTSVSQVGAILFHVAFENVQCLESPQSSKLTLAWFQGGYNLKSLAESSALSLRALLDDPTPAIAPITAPKHR